MAYDPVRDETLFFGGCCYQGDTWLWKNGTWRLAQPSLSPPARAGLSMAWDGANGDIVMFGGTEEADTWTWDGSAWSLHRPPSSPQFRSDAAMAFSPALQKVILFGGYPNLSTQGQLNDTWEWDGATWTQVQTPHTPPARYGAGLATDPSTGGVLLFGGLDDGYHSLADTWVLSGGDWVQVSTSPAPAARSYPQMAPNGATGAVELFGGYDLEDGASELGDQWIWRGGRWRQLSRRSPPPARCCGGFVHDSSRGSMLLLDGSCSPTCGGMWIEHRGRWQERPIIRPLEREGGGFVRYPRVRGSVLFGGFGDDYGSGELNDTWIWTGRRWKVVNQTQAPGVALPEIRQGTATAYDPRDRRVLLFGGSGPHYPDPQLGDTWTFDGSTWTQLSPATAPPARYDHVMATDPRRGVVLFGGYGKDGVLGDTWVFGNGRWRQEHPPTAPAARYWGSMAWDPATGQTILFGGAVSGGVSQGDTWAWDGAAWAQLDPPTSPPSRVGASMTYDPSTRLVWLFGGATCASAACVLMSDVWTWDGTTWARQVATGGPGALWFANAAPNPAGGVVLVGGQDGGTDLPSSQAWLWTQQASR